MGSGADATEVKRMMLAVATRACVFTLLGTYALVLAIVPPDELANGPRLPVGIAGTILLLQAWFLWASARKPYVTVDGHGVTRASNWFFLRARTVGWGDVVGAELLAFKGIRLSVSAGRGMTIPTLELDGGPDDVLRAIRRYVGTRSGAVSGDFPDTGASTGEPLDGDRRPLEFTPRFDRQGRKMLLEVVAGMVVVTLVVPPMLGLPLTVIPMFLLIILLVSGLSMAAVFLISGKLRVRLDSSGIAFGSGGRARLIAWSEVVQIRGFTLENGNHAIDVGTRDGDGNVKWSSPYRYITLEWAPVSAQEVVDRMRHLAYPHRFEGP
ncbi:MAG TPA: hypothetical protein VI341_04000 [Actinomycetota bacterium]